MRECGRCGKSHHKIDINLSTSGVDVRCGPIIYHGRTHEATAGALGSAFDEINCLRSQLAASEARYRDLAEAMGTTVHQPHEDLIKLIQEQASAEIRLLTDKAQLPNADLRINDLPDGSKT